MAMVNIKKTKKKIKCKRLKSIEGLDMPLVTGKDAKILLAFRSPYQYIEIVDWENTGKKALLLNGEVQYIEGKPSKDYHLAHSSLLKRCPENTKRIAIIGGGDGILAGYLSELYPNSQIFLFELDPCMIYVFSVYERAVNKNAYHRKNVYAVIGDAFKTIKRFPKNYFDAMFIDLPDAYNNPGLYSDDNIQLLLSRLKNGGCISIYTGGIPSSAFMYEFLPECIRILGVKRVVGMFGGVGEIIHARKTKNNCGNRNLF